MKRYITIVLVAILLAGGTVTVSAQTSPAISTSALQALINSLQEQVMRLTAQIAALQKVQTTVSTATTTPDIASLIANLREGSEGEGVKMLQAILAADSGIYPEGKITGYFGKLTANAIKRYQRSHDIKESGKIEQKTIEELKKEAESNQVKIEDHNGERIACMMVAPGHLIAPGWLRKMGGDHPIVPECQTLPRGIEKQEQDNEDHIRPTTTETVAPVISQIIANGITASTARIEWSTNESGTSVVWYGTSTPVVTGAATSATVAGLNEDHSVALSGLMANTTYYYVVSSADEHGNVATSNQYSFTTLAQPAVIVPIISGISATSVMATSSHITWSTNIPATSVVWYSTSTPVVVGTASSVSDGALVTNHDATLTNLASSTMYYYSAVSSDAAGNTATSTQSSFQTPAAAL